MTQIKISRVRTGRIVARSCALHGGYVVRGVVCFRDEVGNRPYKNLIKAQVCSGVGKKYSRALGDRIVEVERQRDLIRARKVTNATACLLEILGFCDENEKRKRPEGGHVCPYRTGAGAERRRLSPCGRSSVEPTVWLAGIPRLVCEMVWTAERERRHIFQA
jgi:hypothetical protein